MGKKYERPPIIEVLCEFQFSPDTPWDLVMPGLIYEKLRNTFPKRRQVKLLSVGVSGTSVALEPHVKDRMQFLQEDEKILVQVDSRLLAVNHLKPYSSWQEFCPLIKRSFKAYCDVVRPKNINRIGLKYINRIEFAAKALDQSINLADYFEFYPLVETKLLQELKPSLREFNTFIVGIQVPYEGSRDTLKLQLASANMETPGVIAVTLDLDYFLVKLGKIKLDDVFEWIDVAHNRIKDVFESCIKDRLRQTFGEVKE